jgi:hypothetical protein
LCVGGCGKPGLGPAAEFISFASPKETNQRKGEPEPVPCGSPALLAVCGVWLNSLRSNNASPDPPTTALLGTASMAGGRERVREPDTACSLAALTLHAVWVVSRFASLALERLVRLPVDLSSLAVFSEHASAWKGCWQSREFAMAKPSKRISAPSAVVTGLSSAAAGGSGWRMFEA